MDQDSTADQTKEQRPLKPKQELFCQFYVALKFNGTGAAIQAGYSKNAAASIAAENLRKPHIQARIAEIVKDLLAGIELTKERVWLEVSRLAFSDIRGVLNPDSSIKGPEEWSDHLAAAVGSLKVTETFIPGKNDNEDQFRTSKEVRLWEKGKNLKLAAQLLGLLVEKREIVDERSYEDEAVQQTNRWAEEVTGGTEGPEDPVLN